MNRVIYTTDENEAGIIIKVIKEEALGGKLYTLEVQTKRGVDRVLLTLHGVTKEAKARELADKLAAHLSGVNVQANIVL